MGVPSQTAETLQILADKVCQDSVDCQNMDYTLPLGYVIPAARHMLYLPAQ